jgi:hypothetical protein
MHALTLEKCGISGLEVTRQHLDPYTPSADDLPFNHFVQDSPCKPTYGKVRYLSAIQLKMR